MAETLPTKFKIKTIAIKGTFIERDWKELGAAIRKIERRHPEELFQLVVLDNDLKLGAADAMNIIEKSFPHLPEGEQGHHTLDEIMRALF